MISPIKIMYFKLPIGEIIIGDYKGSLCLCDWKFRAKRMEVDTRIQQYLNTNFVKEFTPLHENCIKQLQEYFSRKRNIFDLPLLFSGSDFQKKVWVELLKIPYGETRNYLQLSKQLNNEKAIRAVAAANGANALSIIVPCHRVIASSGDLQGYAGGLPAKRYLLELEGSAKQMSLLL